MTNQKRPFWKIEENIGEVFESNHIQILRLFQWTMIDLINRYIYILKFNTVIYYI